MDNKSALVKGLALDGNFDEIIKVYGAVAQNRAFGYVSFFNPLNGSILH